MIEDKNTIYLKVDLRWVKPVIFGVLGIKSESKSLIMPLLPDSYLITLAMIINPKHAAKGGASC